MALSDDESKLSENHSSLIKLWVRLDIFTEEDLHAILSTIVGSPGRIKRSLAEPDLRMTQTLGLSDTMSSRNVHLGAHVRTSTCRYLCVHVYLQKLKNFIAFILRINL